MSGRFTTCRVKNEIAHDDIAIADTTFGSSYILRNISRDHSLDLARQLAPGMVLVSAAERDALRGQLAAFRAFVRAWDAWDVGPGDRTEQELALCRARDVITPEMMGDE